MKLTRAFATGLLPLVLLAAAACGSDDDGSGNSGSGGPGVGGAGGNGSSDFPEASVAQCSYPTISDAQVLQALATGDARAVTDVNMLLEATQTVAGALRTTFDADLIALFDLGADGKPRADGSSLTAIDWNPTHDAITMSSTVGLNTPVLVSNGVRDTGTLRAEPLAILGKSEGARYLVFGSNPFRTSLSDDGANEQMHQFLRNAVRLLTGKTNTAGAPLKIVMAQLIEEYFFPDDSETRKWFDTKYGGPVSYNEADACDADKLSGCLNGADLLIVSGDYQKDTQDPKTIAKSVAQALAANVPVVYLQADGSLSPLGEALFETFHVGYVRDNYWDKLLLKGFDGTTTVGKLPATHESVVDALRHLKADDFSFETAAIAAAPADNADYQVQFAAGANAARDMLRNFDSAGVDIFRDCTHTFEKMLVLTGDRLRQDVKFPMSVATTPTNTFLRSYFADHTVYNTRGKGIAQPDRGNFDPKDLSGVNGTTHTVTIKSRPNFRAAGAYLLPGKTARITRTDTSDEVTRVFVNTIRDSATHEWDTGEKSYPRPKFLQSAHIPLKAGQPVVITSPYGGPLQIEFEGTGKDVSVTFENVGEHAHWRGPADDATFAQRLQADVFNWVEVATEGFELHSRLDYYRDTIKDARFETPAKMVPVIDRYTVNDFHVLAGFQGVGIDKNPEVYDWAVAKGLPVAEQIAVKHGNMDQATCGAGCSGNPYDSYWAFSPIAHGDLHELGHGVEDGRFLLTHGSKTYGGHGTTNWWAFYGAARYYEDHGGEGGSWGVTHDAIFAELQAAYAAGERAGTFSARMNSYFEKLLVGADDINGSYSFYLQAMMAARNAGKLIDGYHLVPRAILLNRAFKAALSDTTTWEAARQNLGFSQFTFEEAKAIGNNDFMAVALSYATGLDYRDFFAMWGTALGDRAKSQIGSFAYEAVPRAFFVLDPTDHTRGALKQRHGEFQKIVLDGTTAWPLTKK